MNTQATDQEKIFTILYIYLKKDLHLEHIKNKTKPLQLNNKDINPILGKTSRSVNSLEVVTAILIKTVNKLKNNSFGAQKTEVME